MTRFLALDPSSTNVGWAIFDDDRLVAWGNISTKKVDYSFRFQFIVNELIHTVQSFNPTEIASEETKFRWKGREIASLRVAFVSIRKWAEKAKLPMVQYNVSTWKSSVLGNQHASKEDTAATVRLLFPRLPANVGEHEIDAIGVGVYHAGILKLQGMAVAKVQASFAHCVKCGGPVEGSEGKKGFSICRKCAGEVADRVSPADRLALAKTGLDALIDEATGFEKIRPKDDLAKRLRKYRGAK